MGQGVEVRDIVALTDIFPDQASFPWQAVPDSLFTTFPFLPAPAEELLQTGQFHGEVEVILGTCKDEGLSDFSDAWLDPEFFESIRDTWDTAGTARILGLMRYSDVTPADVEKARKIIDAYVGGVGNFTMSNIQSLVDMMTDSSMLYGVHKTIGYLLEEGMTVYQYVPPTRDSFQSPNCPPCCWMGPHIRTVWLMPTTSSTNGNQFLGSPGTPRLTSFPETTLVFVTS